MASEWEVAPLEDCVANILDRRGITPKKLGATFVSDGHRVISAKAIKGQRVDLAADEPRFVNEDTYRKWMRTPLLKDDVILTSEAPLGEPAYVAQDTDWCLGQRLFGIRTNKDKLYGRFLFYALQSAGVRHDLLARATGTTAQGIRQAELRRVLIPIPPLPEQRAIAHVLGTLDDKIELNRRMNQTLEEMARALFKSWFVDFDPVRAKAALKRHALGSQTGPDAEPTGNGAAPAGEWTVERAHAYLDAMDSQIVDLFPDQLVDSELGKVPDRWEVKSIGDLADVSSGKRPPRRLDPADHQSQIPLWGGNGPIGLVDTPLVDSPILLTGRVGTLGSVFRITTPCWPSDNTLVVRVWSTSLFDFLFFRMSMIDFKSLNRGSTQPLLTQRDLKAQAVAVPTGEILDCFHKLTTELLGCGDRVNQQLTSLSGLRDSLLPKLILGEIMMASIE